MLRWFWEGVMAKLRSPEMLHSGWRTRLGWCWLKSETKLELELCRCPSWKREGPIRHQRRPVFADAGARTSLPLLAGVVFGSHAGELT